MNLPNQLTVARFIMALVFVGLMSFHIVACYFLAYLVFIAATLTDYYDGKIARERNLITNFGKLLDPVADKVLLIGAFVMLMGVPLLHVPGWTIVAIIAREFLITGVRSLAATEGHVIAADSWGKAKTVIQIIYVLTFLALAIIIRLIESFPSVVALLPGGLPLYAHIIRRASFWAIVAVAVFTVYSGIQFMRVNWKALHIGSEL